MRQPRLVPQVLGNVHDVLDVLVLCLAHLRLGLLLALAHVPALALDLEAALTGRQRSVAPV